MSGKIIATIYFYVISVISLVLIIIGIFNTVNFVINATQYDKYPLRYGLIADCESNPYSYKPAIDVSRPEATPTPEELEKQKQNCEKQQELDRKQHRIENIRDAITFNLVGVLLFAIHFPLARKWSKN